MRHRLLASTLLAATAIALVACSGSSGGSVSPSGEIAASIAPASSSPASEASPSSATQSEAPSSAPSDAPVAIPSFAFPSTDKELEALLPDTLCGKKVQKASMGGAVFDNAADPAFVAMLNTLGKTTSDVSMAFAAPTSSQGCSAGIFRIKGADSAALKAAFLAESVKQGNNFTEVSLGGKTVYVDPKSKSFGYAYFKGDAIIFASADNDKDAAGIIAALP